MRFQRRTRLPTHPSGSLVNKGVRGKVAHERPRRQPKVFPKSHGPYPLCRCATSPPDRGSRSLAVLWFLSDRSERNSPRSGEPSVSFFRGCSACGRATFQRRKVAKVLRACGPGPRRVALFRWYSRSARCPHEGCLNFITAVLLNSRDRCFYKMQCA